MMKMTNGLIDFETLEDLDYVYICSDEVELNML